MRRYATFRPSAHRTRAGGPGLHPTAQSPRGGGPGLAQMAGLTLAFVGPPVIASIGRPALGEAPSLSAGLAGQAALVLLAVTVLAILRRWQRQPIASIGLRPFGARSLAFAAALLLFFRFIFLPATSFVLTRLGVAGWDAGVAALGTLPTWYLTFAVIVGPAVEEILYRGY